MSASALALLLLAALPLSAQDLGEAVTWASGGTTARFASDPGAKGSLWSAEGLPVPVPWDTILFQGVSPDEDVTFELARQDAAGAWGDWVKADVKRFPGGRFWAKARLAPAAPGALRLRALSGPAASGREVEIYGVEVFAGRKNPAARAADAQDPAPQLPAPAGRPPVHLRAEWKAKPPKEPYTDTTYYRITLHHTSGPQTKTVEDSLREVLFIQDFHQNGRGWNDIAYHYLIDGAGNIFEGRPEGKLGAHTKNNNEGNFGIVLLGTYQAPYNHTVSPAQRAALIALGRYAVARHGIDPETLKGHRDYKATDCPGDLVYPLIPDLRKEFRTPKGKASGLVLSPLDLPSVRALLSAPAASR